MGKAQQTYEDLFPLQPVVSPAWQARLSDPLVWTDKKTDQDKAEVTVGNEMEHLKSHN